MSKNDRFLDCGPALFGGYRVALMTNLRCDGQALFDTAADVAACAALLGVAVLTSDDRVVAACRALGVATALPPQCARKAWRYESELGRIGRAREQRPDRHIKRGGDLLQRGDRGVARTV